MADPIQLFITSLPSNNRREFPLEYVQSFTAKILRYGGYADFSMSTTLPWDSGLVSWVSHTDMIELFYQGKLRYRGYVRARTRAEEEPHNLVIEGYSALLGVRNQICQTRVVSPITDQDVSSVFSRVVNSFLVGAKASNGAILVPDVQTSLVGVVSPGIDAYNRLTGDVLDELQTQYSNLCSWGVDVNPKNQDRIYLRKQNTAGPPDHVIIVPSPDVQVAQSQEQESDIRNILLVTGGNPVFPQLCHNGDFKLPVFHQDGVTNIVTNGGFEQGQRDRSGNVQNWSTTGNTSIKGQAYDSSSVIQPYEGNNCLQLDHAGNSAYQTQTQTYTANHTYVFSLQSAKQQAEQDAAGNFQLELKDSSGTTLFNSGFVSLTLRGNNYTYCSIAVNMPANVTSATFRISATSVSAFNGRQGGIIIDDVQFYDGDLIYQDGWETVSYGSGQVRAVDWNHVDTDGSNCIYMYAIAQDQDGQDAALRVTDQARIRVRQGQDLKVSFLAKTPFPDYLVVGAPKISLQMQWYDSNGSLVNPTHKTTVITQGQTFAEWSYFSTHAYAFDQNIQFLRPYINWRGNGVLLIKDISVVDYAGVDVPYLPEGPMTFLVKSDDPAIAAQLGYTPVYNGSRARYGDLSDVVTQNAVLNSASAIRVAHTYFMTHAVSDWKPSITVLSDPRVYMPGELVSLQGTDGPGMIPAAENIVDITLSWDGIFKTQIDLQTQQEDMVGVVQSIVRDQLRKLGPNGQGPGGSAGYSSNSGGSGSLSLSSTYRTTLQASATDATLHDAFLTAPHASAANQSTWTGTTGEVVSGRTRTVKGVSSTSLEGRLDAMEVDILAGGTSSTGVASVPAWLYERESNPNLSNPATQVALPVPQTGTTYVDLTACTPDTTLVLVTLSGDLVDLNAAGASRTTVWGQKSRYTTELTVLAAKTIQVTASADNAARCLLNGTQVGVDFGDAYAGPGQLGNPVTLTLSLVTGRNTLQFRFAQDNDGGASNSGFTCKGVGGTLASLVDQQLAPNPVATGSGTASTVSVGTTTTGAPGTSAAVSNTGTPTAAVLNFTVPQGTAGTNGATGPTGATGPAGATGPSGFTPAAGAAAQNIFTKQIPSAESVTNNVVIAEARLASGVAASEGSIWEWQTSGDAGTTWQPSVFTGTHYEYYLNNVSQVVFRTRLLQQLNGTATAWTTSANVQYMTIGAVLKRRFQVTMYPQNPSTADTAPNTTQVLRLPRGTGGTSSIWKLALATLRAESPGASATTAQVYYSASPGNAAFGAGTACLTAALSLSGTSAYEVSTSSFTGTLGSVGISSGSVIAPQFSALSGTGVSIETEWEEV